MARKYLESKRLTKFVWCDDRKDMVHFLVCRHQCRRASGKCGRYARNLARVIPGGQAEVTAPALREA